MFELSADVYDLIYSFKDYGAESQWDRDTIRAACPKARALLDVACGTGSQADGLHVVRMGHKGRDGDTAVLTMHHLVGTPVTIDHFVETHRLRLYTLDEYEAAFRAAGLTFAVDQPGPEGRGALIGRRS